MNASASLPPREIAPDALSKTKRKRDMHALQDLGAELVALDAKRLASLNLPERLADAIALARAAPTAMIFVPCAGQAVRQGVCATAKARA